MSSVSETGHARNVANFEKIYTNISAIGASYTPTKASIKLAAISAQLVSSKAALAAVSMAEANYKLAVSNRKSTFAPIKKMTTRINNALQATDTSPEIVESAKTLIRRLQGKRATPKMTKEQKAAAEAAGDKTVEISASRLSFDNQIENWDKLIKQLATIASFAPNEADLKTANLTVILNDLKLKNQAVPTTLAALNLARISRNDILYKPHVGIVDVSNDVKTYIKSVFGGTSPQYSLISRLKVVSLVRL